MNLLIHIENADRIGIYPSHLDDIRIMAKGLGIQRLAYIDQTLDGHIFSPEWERYQSIEDWLKQATHNLIFFETENVPRIIKKKSTPATKLIPPADSWIAFGPSTGFNPHSLATQDITWCHINNIVMSARDAVPIGIWIMTNNKHG